MNNFVALDFETANRYMSSVCSIGLVFVENGLIVDTYYRLIKPIPNFYSYFNTQIHGITQSDTETASLFPEIWQEVLPKIENLPIVAHNSPFDEGCLRAVLAAYELPKHRNLFYCTCRKARKVFVAQVPTYLQFSPAFTDFVVLASGVVEITLGLAMLLIWKRKAVVGALLAIFYVLIFPGNINQYINNIDAFGLNTYTARLVRLFFQPVLVFLALWSTGGYNQLKIWWQKCVGPCEK